MSESIKPGTDNKPAGTYHEVGPRGGSVPGARIVHIQKGDRLRLPKNLEINGLRNKF